LKDSSKERISSTEFHNDTSLLIFVFLIQFQLKAIPVQNKPVAFKEA
jgi:hypothetical protein